MRPIALEFRAGAAARPSPAERCGRPRGAIPQRCAGLTEPGFERAGLAWPRLWLARWLWRRRLGRLLAGETAETLADLGTSAAALRDYVGRPAWRR